MRHILMQLQDSNKTLGVSTTGRFYVEDSRLQRNLERVVADPLLTSAVLSGVLADNRAIETMVRADASVRAIILRVEKTLGRRLGRERAQKLLKQYQLVVARQEQFAVSQRQRQVQNDGYALAA